MSEASATTLTDAQLAELREQAGRPAGSFVDPAQLRRVVQFVSGRNAWASAVTGRSFDLRSMTNRELVLLDLAAKAEPEPPVSPRPPAPWEPGYVPTEQERAVNERRAAAYREWLALAEALPVRVSVAYNYSGPHHYEFHTSGADHIIVREPLQVGRIHRGADRALCETPSKRRLLFVGPADYDAPEDRVATCKACLRTAYRITGREPAAVLLKARR